MKRLLLTGLVLLHAAAVSAQQTAPQPPPPVPPVEFTVEVRGTIADFSIRMDAYAALRDKLQQGIPVLAVTDDPAEILRAERLLAERIRKARAGARRHDIFTEPIRNGFRRVLRALATTANCALIADDNPGEFDYRVNATYPKALPVSTVPAAMLAALPRLPDDVYYRFLDGDLILHDTRANIILDRIDNAIRCDR